MEITVFPETQNGRHAPHHPTLNKKRAHFCDRTSRAAAASDHPIAQASLARTSEVEGKCYPADQQRRSSRTDDLIGNATKHGDSPHPTRPHPHPDPCRRRRRRAVSASSSSSLLLSSSLPSSLSSEGRAAMVAADGDDNGTTRVRSRPRAPWPGRVPDHRHRERPAASFLLHVVRVVARRRIHAAAATAIVDIHLKGRSGGTIVNTPARVNCPG